MHRRQRMWTGALICLAGLLYAGPAAEGKANGANPSAWFWQDAWEPISTTGPNRLRGDQTRSAPDLAAYHQAVLRTAAMVADPEAQQLAEHFGLNVLNLTWEDTGRYKGSAVGPNISDMTIQVASMPPGSRRLAVTCMPVIRFPNFSDVTCELDPKDFTLLVGNERGSKLTRVSLYDFLKEPTRFLSKPDSWPGRGPKTLLAPRDQRVLVSAQACFLPVPKSGKATFNPVVFNYQSVEDDPAVLTILATRQGTSTTIIDNKRDAFATGAVWGQRLFHNQNGQRASLTGERLSDFRAAQGSSTQGPARKDEQGLSMVLLVQVPLKQRNPPRHELYDLGGGGASTKSAVPMMDAAMPERRRSDVENAVIGHGDLEGPFTEIANVPIRRDPNFPIRVTVQFYKATSNGIVDQDDLQAIHAAIRSVYDRSDTVGSLVTDGHTGRITEYYGAKVQPPGWWDEFWLRYERNMGISRHEAIAKLRELLGRDYMNRPVCELYLRNLLRQ